MRCFQETQPMRCLDALTSRARRSRPHKVWSPKVWPGSCLLVCALAACWCGTANGQPKEPPPLRLQGFLPAGVRGTATESWGAYDFSVSNKTGTDRAGRVFAFLKGRADVQYGRDVWVPANATLSSWMLVGPAFEPEQGQLTDFELLVYDRAEGKEQRISPGTEQQVRTSS